MTNGLDWLSESLEMLAASNLRREKRIVQSLPGGRCVVEGEELWNFAGNDVFCLRHHPAVIAAARDAEETHGTGSGASGLVTGHSPEHAKLEQAVAEFEQTESALLFPTGFAANLGVVAALAGPGDVVFCDRWNHASLVTGCRASGAKLRVYRHTQTDQLKTELAKETGNRRRLIVTDGLFSMDGNFAPLAELVEIAETFDTTLVVDEAHATGIYGENGRGSCERVGVEERVAVRVGTLSKSLGGMGGFVAGSRLLCDWLLNHAATQMFSTALPPASCAAAGTSLRILQSEPQRRTRLIRDAERFRHDLRARGVSLSENCESHIIPIVLGTPEAALSASESLRRRGFLVPAIRPPTVPKGTSRLRISLFDSDSRPEFLLTELAEAVVEVSHPSATRL